VPSREQRISWLLDALARVAYPLFRPARMRRFYQEMEISATTRVLDIGGNRHVWRLAEQENLPVPRVVFANIEPPKAESAGADWVLCDGRALPFADQAFDVAFSNSVIEHVGTWESQQRFAAEVRRVARRYFVQTPNRRFFFEPHLLTPFVHWLPRPLLRRMIRNGTVLGWVVRPHEADVEAYMRDTRLLTRGEVEDLFPDGRLVVERFCGMPKSFVTVR